MSAVADYAPAASTATAESSEKRLMLGFLVAGFTALMVGVAIGPLQALNYAGLDLYPYLRPVLQTYYQGLTIHGVLNGYVFTFFLGCGLMVYLPARELGLSPNMTLWRLCFWLMTIGGVLVLYAMFDNSSSVLWTFYPPLKGSPFFYIGLTLVVLGTLMPGPIVLGMRARWKAEHPGQVTPLVTYMASATMLMWMLAAVGAGIELIVMLDPWSLGLTKDIDPIIARTLFWWTGHPIVYFWLMPAYMSWYGLLGKQVGGKLISDAMPRLTFTLLLIFSLPVGSHHQFMDPGFSPIWRGILVALTLSVALPSLITAFTMALTLEYAGRLRGGRGLLGWFTALPWRNPSVAAQVLSMLLFIFGGASGIVQGSWQLDNIVHNTVWVPGHFHMTVGAVVAMTFMAISFWMLPHLTGRRLACPRLALSSAWLWFVGMGIFGFGMLWSGLEGVPRRAWLSSLPHSTYLQVYGDAHTALILVGVGGCILWLAALCFYTTFYGSFFTGPVEKPVEIPFAEKLDVHDGAPISPLSKVLEHLGLITLFTACITIAAYGPMLWPMVHHMDLVPGWKVW